MIITNHYKSNISKLALILLTVGAIDSIRNLPATALFGSQIPFFVIAAALFFLIPCALVAAEMSARWSDRSGIYIWIKTIFGDHAGLVAIWLQWINTLIWFPTILSFIASTFATILLPDLANNKLYFMGIILSVFWGITLINLRGFHVSAKFTSICSFFGMVIPMLGIIVLGFIWVITNHPVQISLQINNLMPHFSSSNTWLALTGIITSFLGIELSSTHINAIKNPQRNFPKILFISTFIIVVTIVLGSLSIAVVTPNDKISLVSGVIESFSLFLTSYHLQAILPLLVFMIIIGSIGGMVNWILSPNKGILHAVQDGLLPNYLGKLNRSQVPARLLICHAVIVSIVSLVILLEHTINSAYWLLTALSTQIYVILYVLMLIAGLYSRYKLSVHPTAFKVPGGKIGMWICCLMGLFGCFTTLFIGFIPPTNIENLNTTHYEILFVGGLILMCSPPFIWFYYKNNISKNKAYLKTSTS